MEIEPIYLFDKNKELIDIIPFDNLTANSQDWTLNGLIKGSVTGIYTDSIEQAHFYGTHDIDEPNVFWQYKIVNYTKENGQFTFEGIYVLFDDLAGRGVIRDRRPKNAPITTVLGYVLEDTGWQIGNVQSTHTGTSNYYYVSKLEAFWDFISKWRVEFKPRMTFSGGKVTGKYIDIYDRLSDDYGKWYEYGDNLLTVMAEEMRENVFTAFIGRGKGEEVGDGFGRKIDFSAVNWTVASGKPVDKPVGQDYIEIPWATDLYGYEDGTPRMTVIDFPDIEDDDELINATYDYGLTECRPKVQFKANVLETGRADVGEIVTILRPDMGIRYKTRVFNLRRDFLNGAIKTIQFGEQLVQTTAQRTKKTATAIKKQEEQTVYWLTALRKAIVDSYFNEDGYNYDLSADNEYDLPGGYYSFDRPIDQNPTKVVYTGAGKILIANSNNPDGSWNWRTAITGDGITLDAVNTGTLTAGRILSAISGSYWDLDNDVFHMENGDIQLLDTATGNLVSLDYQGVTTINGANGSYARLSPNGSVVSSNGEDGRYATMANGRSWYYNEEESAVLNIGAHPVAGLPGLLKGTVAAARAQRLVIGRYNDYLQSNPNATVNPYITLEYGSTVGDESVTFVKMWKDMSMSGKKMSDVQDISGYELKVRSTEGRLRLGVKQADSSDYNTLEVGFANTISNGSIDMQGYNITNQSDIRLKTNVVDSAVNALKEIERMKFIEYDWDISNPANSKKPDGRQFGIVAQYSPFLQTKAGDSESYLSVDMTKQVNLNSKAIQELKKENDTLKQELADLKTLLTEKGLI